MVTRPTPILDRTVRAVADVWERAETSAAALETAGLPHAISGDCAAYEHVERAEPTAVRFPATVEAVVARRDRDRVREPRRGWVWRCGRTRGWSGT